MDLVRQFLVVCLIFSFFGCGKGNNETESDPKKLGQGEIYTKHNSSSCPVNLVGVYQTKEPNQASPRTLTIKIFLQPDRTLTVVPMIDNQSTSEILVVDGKKQALTLNDPNGYRVSYCENFLIMSVSESFGRVFTIKIAGSGNGISVSTTENNGTTNLIYYPKIKASDYFIRAN